MANEQINKFDLKFEVYIVLSSIDPLNQEGISILF